MNKNPLTSWSVEKMRRGSARFYTAPMPAPSATPPHEGAGERLPRVFLGILLVELLTIAGLYWMGLRFSA